MKSNLPPVPSGANQLATRRFLITWIIHMLKWPTTRPPYQRRRRGLAIRALLCQNLLLTLHPTSTPCAVKRNGGWEVLHKKAYINAYSWLSENLAIFRITVKDSATVDATGMYIPIRLISSLMLEMSLGYSHTAWSLRWSIHCDGPGQMPLKAEWATVRLPLFFLLTNSHSELVENIHSPMAN